MQIEWVYVTERFPTKEDASCGELVLAALAGISTPVTRSYRVISTSIESEGLYAWAPMNKVPPEPKRYRILTWKDILDNGGPIECEVSDSADDDWSPREVDGLRVCDGYIRYLSGNTPWSFARIEEKQ